MNPLLILLATKLSIGLTEIIVFQLVSLVLGFAIHFYLTQKKIMPSATSEPAVLAAEPIGGLDEWRLKFYEEKDLREQLKRELEDSKEKQEMLEIEVEDLKEEIARLEAALPEEKEEEETEEQQVGPTFMAQLKSAQDNLHVQNQYIGKLLQQVDTLKESEQKYSEVQQLNETLGAQLREARRSLMDKEAELKQLRQQQLLNNEVKGRLERAYEEFGVLQDRLQKIESATAPQHKGFEYEELQQAYFKITREFDELKMKQVNMLEEHQRLARLLADTEDKLRESNFQRQQLLKKVGYLEELNTDLQQVSEHNKKLDIQLKRISEIENLLARLSSEKDNDQKKK
jgi:DNA repair exonuclease SbcCD ATPase subunit